MQKRLCLCRVEMLHRVGVGAAGALRHGAHEGSRIDLGARAARHAQVPDHLMWHALLRAWLTLIVSHGRRHGMAGRHAGMLLHAAWMRKARSHTCHHFQMMLSLSTIHSVDDRPNESLPVIACDGQSSGSQDRW